MSMHDLRVGFFDAMTKASWGTAHDTDAVLRFDAQREVSISGARNEVVGEQLRIMSKQDFIVTLNRSNWLHPLGFRPRVRVDVRFPTLPENAVETFTIGYVEGDDRRQWMEVLDRADCAEVPAYQSQGVYVRIRIPADVEACV